MNKPGYNIMKISEDIFTLACECGSPDHYWHLIYNWDDECEFLELTIETKYLWYCEWKWSRWRRFREKVKATFKIWFWGWLELRNDFMIRDREHAEGIIYILDKYKNKMR